MTVYLIHMNTPMAHGLSKAGNPMTTQHYIGYTEDLVGRLLAHADGHGARLLQVCKERGIDFKLARTWDGAGRRFERRLKNQKKSADLCPFCNPASALRRMVGQS